MFAQADGLLQLHISANSTSPAQAAFACPHLMHSGLSLNHTSSLRTSRNSNPGSSAGQANTASQAMAASRAAVKPSSTTSQQLLGCSQNPNQAAVAAASSTASSSARSCSALVLLDVPRHDITDLPAVLEALKQLSHQLS